jgi:hypothetical protein
LPSSKDKKKKKKKRNKKKRKKKKKGVYTSREQDRGNGSDDDEDGYADAKENRHSLSEGSRNDLFPSDVSNSGSESDGDAGSIQGSLEDELTNMRLNPTQASERLDRNLEILRGNDPNRRTLGDLIQAGLRRERNDPRSIDEVVQEVIADRLHGLQETKVQSNETVAVHQSELEGDPYEDAARALRMAGLDRDDDEGEDEPPIVTGSSSSSESGGNTRNRKSKRGRFGFYDIDGMSKFIDEDGLLTTLVPSNNLPELFAYEDSSYPGGTPRATCTIGDGGKNLKTKPLFQSTTRTYLWTHTKTCLITTSMERMCTNATGARLVAMRSVRAKQVSFDSAI